MCCSRGAVATEQGRCGPGRRSGRPGGHSRPREAPLPFTLGSVKLRYITTDDLLALSAAGQDLDVDFQRCLISEPGLQKDCRESRRTL